MSQENKIGRTRIAAQAIALSVPHSGGAVRAALFGRRCPCSPTAMPAAGLRSCSCRTYGGSSPATWSSSSATAVLIPPQTNPGAMRSIADTVIQVDNPSAGSGQALDDLPWLLGMLIPRTRIA